MTNCIIDKCINIGSITKNSTKNYKSSTLVMTHHLSKPHFGYLVNFTIMSWLFLTVVQFVILNFFHKRNNLTNRFCSGFKVSDSVSMMTKFKFRWQNRCWDKMMVVTKNPVRHPSPTSVSDIDVVTGSPYIWPDLDVVPLMANFRGMSRFLENSLKKENLVD